MRLWHYILLPLLDDKHIVAQWRELLAIKGAIDKNGTPNHRLVNKVLDYPVREFKKYTYLVEAELKKRHIKYSNSKVQEIYSWENTHFPHGTKDNWKVGDPVYCNWHNERYLSQCVYNLQEKYDCGIVSQEAWYKIWSEIFPF